MDLYPSQGRNILLQFHFAHSKGFLEVFLLLYKESITPTAEVKLNDIESNCQNQSVGVNSNRSVLEDAELCPSSDLSSAKERARLGKGASKRYTSLHFMKDHKKVGKAAEVKTRSVKGRQVQAAW